MVCFQLPFSSPTRLAPGTRTSSKTTSAEVAVAGHVDDGAHRDARAAHVHDELGEALWAGASGSVRQIR